MGSRCNLICCPNCGYQVVDESKSRFANLLHRLWPPPGQSQEKGQQARESSVVPLTHIPVGRTVEVCRLADMPPNRMTRLSAFGLVPGSRVEVLQRRPAPVVRVGETELALSEQILGQIWVRTGHGAA
jgi:Fe2+ transport system protein FeoA